jgi:hypothetical protein
MCPDSEPYFIILLCFTCKGERAATEENQSLSLKCIENRDQIITLPNEWKSAAISPIFKKGSKHDRDSYRQISLTCIVCKISEKIIRDRMISFWNDLNVFNKYQFAYIKGRSTVTHLLSTLDD